MSWSKIPAERATAPQATMRWMKKRESQGEGTGSRHTLPLPRLTGQMSGERVYIIHGDSRPFDNLRVSRAQSRDKTAQTPGEDGFQGRCVILPRLVLTTLDNAQTGEYASVSYDCVGASGHKSKGTGPCLWCLPTIACLSGNPPVTPAYPLIRTVSSDPSDPLILFLGLIRQGHWSTH
jgi:hypothetical protein